MPYWEQNWKRKVQDCRCGKRNSKMSFCSPEFAKIYDKRMQQERYPGILLQKVQEKISPKMSVLDVGAGTGFFTIPLAKSGCCVTAIEPNQNAVDLLKEKVKQAKLNNVTIINQRWENIQIEPHYAVISVHSLYRILDIVPSLQKMVSLSKNLLCLIIRVNQYPGELHQKLYSSFKSETVAPPKPAFIDLYNLLFELGIYSNAEIVEHLVTIKFNTLDEEIDYWSERLQIDSEKREDLGEIIKQKAELIDGHWQVKTKYCDAIIWKEFS